MNDDLTPPSEEVFKPAPDPSRSESVKPAEIRRQQAQVGRQRVEAKANDGTVRENPIVNDETYGSLREDNRVVMRHTIALNIENFRAASEEFEPRPERVYPPLQEAVTPFFSVVIPTYNGESYVLALLQALRRQSFKDFEIILVDDASTDNTVSRVEKGFPEVRVIVNRQNGGFAASCNTGASAATGRILVLLNNDTEPDERWLEKLALAVVANPQAASFASKILLFDRRDTLHTAGDLMGRDGIARNRGVWETDQGQFDRSAQIFSACGGAAAYRREVWQALGGYDEEFWMYLEDVDFGFRSRLAGWDAVLAPDAKVYHHLSATGGGTLASYFVGRNSIRVIAKNLPLGLFWRNLPSILAAQARVSADAVENIRGAAARARLRGQLAGLLSLPRLLPQRKTIQQRRVIEDAALERLLT
jgi:GT2 family glycosyltransferase